MDYLLEIIEFISRLMCFYVVIDAFMLQQMDVYIAIDGHYIVIDLCLYYNFIKFQQNFLLFGNNCVVLFFSK